MAFIYRADNDRDLFQKSSSLVGPGEYLDKIPKISPRQNQKPFLSSTDKLIEQENKNPGPGTYYKDTQKLKNLRNLEKSRHNKNIDLVVARISKDTITLRPAEKLGFDTKAKRFDFNNILSSNNDFNSTPGPGQYFPSIFNKAKKKNIIKNKRIKLNKSKLDFSKSKKTISIEKPFSTMVIESNTSKMNNKLKRTFQYDNFACRPKLFNIRKYKEIMDNNDNISFTSTNNSDQKNITKFNNFMKTCEIFGLNKKKEMNNSSSTNDIEGKKEIYDFYKNKEPMNRSTMKFRINYCKQKNKIKLKKNIENAIDKLLEGKSPGPGYYFEDINNLEPRPKKLIKTISNDFLSKEERFYTLKKPWTDLGPGEYIDINKEKITKKRKRKENPTNIEIPFNSTEKRNNTFLCLERTIDNPGPGDYEQQPFTSEVEKEGLVDTKFGFTGERFNDEYIMRDRYKAPGPGYYKSQMNSIWYNAQKIKNRNKNERMLLNPYRSGEKTKYKKIQIEKNKFLNGKYFSFDEYKFREKVPPVGYYFPEYFSTIEYKSKLNLLNARNSEVCFNRTISNRLKKSDSAPNIIGPGYYNINREKVNLYNNLHAPFNSSTLKKSFPDKKEKYRMNLEEISKFYMKEYFKWNKKSFNVLFV